MKTSGIYFNFNRLLQFDSIIDIEKWNGLIDHIDHIDQQIAHKIDWI